MAGLHYYILGLADLISEGGIVCDAYHMQKLV